MISTEQRAFFRQNGYVKVEQVIPKANCDRVIEAIWECLGGNPDHPEDWYRAPEGVLSGGGMVEMYHHQAMWDNRQHPALYQVFSELLNETKLWVTLDRVNMKPPVHPDHPAFDTSFIHWDTDTSKLTFPIKKGQRVQGVLYLADTEPHQGGFQCVPAIYRRLEEYLREQPADRNPFVPDLTGYEIETIPGKAGDFVIWDVLLPHGNGKNRADRPRYAQYISMFPAQPHNSALREKRIEQWKHRKHPEGAAFPGDPRCWESTTYPDPPELTPLGRKLLGIDLWEES